MGKKLFALVLLFGVLAMSASVYCQSLCIGGHGIHSSHGAVVRHPSAHPAHQAAHQSAHCDLSHSAPAAAGHGADCPRPGDEESIKCDCSGELTVAYGYHLLPGAQMLHSPVITQVAKVETTEAAYHSPDTPPVKGPPKITA